MGKPDDEMAVVDTHARVYGTQGLRVVDASAFPFLPPGHPQATICEFFRFCCDYADSEGFVCEVGLTLPCDADGFAEKIVMDIVRGD